MPDALDASPVRSLPAAATGQLTLDDMARHVAALRVAVPPGTAALAVTFDHTPQHPGGGAIPHQLSISVIGPAGPRGTRHNHADQSVRIGARAASPGYLAGPLEPGVWTVEIDVHRILPPGGIDWRITAAAVDDVAHAPAPRAAVALAPPGGPGWLRGDLHRHTDHSDAVWPPAAMVADAVARGYDFAALTDHNTTSALPPALVAAGADLLILPGIELTGFHGHALALGPGSGMGRLHDWRIRDGQTMAARAAEMQATGDLFVIAHPMSAGHPFCTGCFWAHPDVMPGPARLVEVWNGPWGTAWGTGPKNPLGLDLFRGWLNAGHRLVATAGSDDHGRYPPGARPGHVLVHAAARTVPAILDGLRAGHVILTAGPWLSVAGHAPGGTPGGVLVRPGDAVPAAVDLHLDWRGVDAGSTARVVAGQRGTGGVRVVWTMPVGDAGSAVVPAAAMSGTDWAMVEVAGPDGTPLAIANPVFLGNWG